MTQSVLHLSQEMFAPASRVLLESSGLNVETFRFPGGVAGLKLSNEMGHLVLLPFQGQQIWSAAMCGRELTMKTMFSEPYQNRDFLSTFGGFFVHCGGVANGIPGQPYRPLHGELPNAPYVTADLLTGEDEHGAYIGLTGGFQYTVAFFHNYIARPVIRLYARSSIFRASMEIENLKHTSMELSYLAHINFRPVDNSRLVYSAPCDPEHMRVITSLGAHLEKKPGYQEFVDDLALHPEKHLVLKPGQFYDPEVVLRIQYRPDPAGWARQLQVHPDGSADVVRHRPAQMGRGVRWISRTPDQDALGFEPGSGTNDQPVVDIAPGAKFSCDLEIGLLDPAEAAVEERLASASSR